MKSETIEKKNSIENNWFWQNESGKLEISLQNPYPEWESSREILSDDCNETFNWSQDGTMNDNRMSLFTAVGDIIQIESDRQLEIELDGSALEWASQCILYGDINFGAIECTIAWIQIPWLAEFVQWLFESLFSRIPNLQIAQVFLWSSWQHTIEGETKLWVNTGQEV